MLGMQVVFLCVLASAALDEVSHVADLHAVKGDAAAEEKPFLLSTEGTSLIAVPPTFRGTTTTEVSAVPENTGISDERNEAPSSTTTWSSLPFLLVYIASGVSLSVIGVLVGSSFLARYVCCVALAVRDPNRSSSCPTPPAPPIHFALPITLSFLYHESIRRGTTLVAFVKSIRFSRRIQAEALPKECLEDDSWGPTFHGIQIILSKQEPELVWIGQWLQLEAQWTERDEATEETANAEVHLTHQPDFFAEAPTMDSFTCIPGWRR